MKNRLDVANSRAVSGKVTSELSVSRALTAANESVTAVDIAIMSNNLDEANVSRAVVTHVLPCVSSLVFACRSNWVIWTERLPVWS